MGRYILKRLLLFIPTLLIVTSLLFVLKSSLPEDEVDRLIQLNGLDETSSFYLDEYRNYSSQLGLDLPTFYFSVQPAHYPEDLHRIIPKSRREYVVDSLRNHSVVLPSVKWHGTGNQYHRWLQKSIKGDFSLSLIDGRSVGVKVGEAFKWTITLLVFSLILSFFIGIPLGIWLAENEHPKIKKAVTALSFVLFATPVFYLCTLTMIFLTTEEYGSWTHLFPSVDLGPSLYEGSFWARLTSYSSHLVLPAICWTLHSLAYLSIQMKVSLQRQFQMPYITTALAKGLSRKNSHRKHALKNALIPMITMIIGSIPSAMAGSVVIEYIFNIPGIGRLLVESIYSLDWNVVMAILVVVSFITMLSYLLGDILYTMANPKIKFESEE